MNIVFQKNKSPSLSLCMIVKNEEVWLKSCLQSVQGLVDEIVIVDTGSSDHTAEIANSFGARLVSHLWKNDFSEARNASLSQAKGDWILVLDADEVIEPGDHQKIRSMLLNPLKPIYRFIQTNYCSESSTLDWVPNHLTAREAQGYPGYVDSPLGRLFPNDSKIRFQGEIHEHVQHENKDYPEITLPLRIHHYGKYSSLETQKRKDELYLKITEEKYRKYPDSAHVCYEMGAQYWCIGQIEKAKLAFEKSLNLDPGYIRAWLALGAIFHQEKKYPEAAKAYAKVMELNPADPSPYLFLPSILVEMKNFVLAEEVLKVGRDKAGDYPVFYLNEGSVKQALGRHKEALLCFQKSLEMNPDESLAWLNQGISELYLGFFDAAEHSFMKAEQYARSRFEANRRLVHLYFKTGQMEKAEWALQKAKLEQPQHAEVLLNEVVLDVQQKKWKDLPEKIEALQKRCDLNLDQQRLLKKCSELIPPLQKIGEADLYSFERSPVL